MISDGGREGHRSGVSTIVEEKTSTRRLSLPLALLLALLLGVALGVRLYGINWDQGHLFHPDERAIYMKVWDLAFPTHDLGLLLDADASPWNPRWFPYGSLPLYLLKAGQALLSLFGSFEFGDLRFLGRVLSAVADTGTVALVFVLGTRIFGRRVGVLAAILVAFSVINLQLSHFYTVETFFTLFIALALLFLLRVMERGRWRDAAVAGAFVGLALATKVSAAPILAAVGVAYLGYAFSQEGSRLSLSRPSVSRVAGAFLRGALTLGVAGLVFFLAAPYAVLDFHRFLADIVQQGQMVTRQADFPYTRQYVDTPSYWYHIQQLAVWGLGLPLGLVAWAGLAFAPLVAWRGRQKGVLLLLAWVVPYFLITGGLQVKFLRYLLPITPFLVLLGAHLLVSLTDAVALRRPRWLLLAQGGVVLVIVATAFYAFAYLNIYARPHTATRASEWVLGNVPSGSMLLTEHWEEGFPNLRECGYYPSDCYRFHVLPMYEADTASKLAEITGALAEGDYVLFFSNRLYGTLPRLPDRYPLSTRYYQALFSGALGYELVHWEATYPSLLGVALVDDTFERSGLPVPAPLQKSSPAPVSLVLGYADESFTVYDHPKVLIFRNVHRLTQGDLLARLLLPPSNEARAPSPGVLGATPTLGLMLTPEELQAQRQAGTWLDVVHPDGWGSRWVPWSWLLLLVLMTAAILPISLLLFRSLPDKGFLLAPVLGILVVAYGVWLLVSLHAAPFTASTIYGVMALVAAISWGVGYLQRATLRASLKEHWRLWVVEGAVLLAAFLGFLLIRMANPDLFHPWRGGEKFMEMAYLTAVSKSTVMPPYDPWFAGGSLNYYYFGYFVVAVFIKALGVAPAVAFNLAVPLLFALTVGGAFCLAYNLAAMAGSPLRRRWGLLWPAVAAGLLGAIFVVVLGNLDGMAQLVQNLWRGVNGGTTVAFDFWRSSRMMPPDPPGFEITEFPFWSFLFADLHPHMMALPFGLLALGLSLAAMLEVSRRGWGKLAVLAALALALGALWPLNTWDYPAYAMIGVAAIVLGLSLQGLRPSSVVRGLALGVLTLALSYGLFLPFHLRYEGFYGGLVWSETQTALWQYLGIHGLFLFIAVTYLVKEATPGLLRSLRALLPSPGPVPSPGHESVPPQGETPPGSPPTPEQAEVLERPLPKATRPVWPALLLATGVLAWLVGLAVGGYLVVALLSAMLGLVVYLLWRPPVSLAGEGPAGDGSSTRFALVLLGMGLAIGIGVELVTVKNDIGRMNTVFKFYEQAWVLLALASAYLVWRLRFGLALSGALRRVPRGAWMGLLGLLLVSTLIFPVLGTRARLNDRFQPLPPTLDGAAYMEQATYNDPGGGSWELRWDLDAIRWLQENVQGSPVVLEGVTPLYRWGNRISVYTGLPAIVGWDWHETQQRGVYSPEVQRRRAAVNRLYTTTDIAEAVGLLREFGVGYVVVGELERHYYPPEGLQKFKRMEGDSLEQVYPPAPVEKATVIYRVKR